LTQGRGGVHGDISEKRAPPDIGRSIGGGRERLV